MKKILFLFGVAGFYTATAQQTDVFDINQYLLKHKPRINLQSKIQLKPGKTLRNSINKNPGDTYRLANGDKVVALPQDRMPCVLPSLKEYPWANISKYDKGLLENLPGNKITWSKYKPLLVFDGPDTNSWGILSKPPVSK